MAHETDVDNPTEMKMRQNYLAIDIILIYSILLSTGFAVNIY